MKIEIAKRLYEYRKVSDMSQEQVAERLGVSRQAVSKWECAESSPDTENLIALAMLYGITVDELLFADPELADPEKGADSECIEENAKTQAREQAQVQEQARAKTDEPIPNQKPPSCSSADFDQNTPSDETTDFNRRPSRDETTGAGWNPSSDDSASSAWKLPNDDSKDCTNISFENGIHVRNCKKGEEVHVGWNGIHVDNAKEHVHLDLSGLAEMIRQFRKASMQDKNRSNLD